jgi:hypothetical protein
LTDSRERLFAARDIAPPAAVVNPPSHKSQIAGEVLIRRRIPPASRLSRVK